MAARRRMSDYMKNWKSQNDQTDDQLAEFIGTSVARLPALATEIVRPGTGPVACSTDDIRRIATQHGANFRRLVEVMSTPEPAATE